MGANKQPRGRLPEVATGSPCASFLAMKQTLIFAAIGLVGGVGLGFLMRLTGST